MAEENEKYIYIMLSQTLTDFGSVIRRVLDSEYNHASIAFESNLENLYSFARYHNCIPFVAGPVNEFPERFTLNKKDYVQVKIYRIPVTPEQHAHGEALAKHCMEDDSYLYNLFSALTFPAFRGISTYKAYTCSEFVVHLMNAMELSHGTEKPACKYTPKDLEIELEPFLYYHGNLLDCCKKDPERAKEYFEKLSFLQMVYESVLIISKLLYRSVRYRF